MIDVGSPAEGLEEGTVPALESTKPNPVKQTESFCADKSVAPSLSAPSSSFRILYRGSLSFSAIEADVPLEGVCFVVRFDSRSALLSSPLPLALESQRGRSTLSIISTLSIDVFDGRLDDSIDLQMYIHPQSLITRAYFERLLCMECISRPDGRTKSCLRVQLGDGHNESDDVVIYGQLIDDVRSSCSVGPPKLRIRVARILPPPPKGRAAPRPDDPLPRTLRFPAAQVALKLKRRPPFPQMSHPHKYLRLDKGPKHAVSTHTEQSMGSVIATQARSFRVSGNGAAIGTMGRIKGYLRKKSSLSVVSTIHELGEDGDEGDVFGASSGRDTDLAGARNKVSNGLFSTPVKDKGLDVPGVTTEEDSLHRSNKDTIKKMVLSMLSSRGIMKDNHEFKELYQTIVRGTTFALRQLMDQRRVEREEARRIVNTHLEMYLPANIALCTPGVA